MALLEHTTAPHVTRAQVMQDEARTQAIRDAAKRLLQANILEPIEDHLDGFKVRLPLGHRYVWLHCLPWSRGWAVFVSDKPNASSYDWRNVPKDLAVWQAPLYCERGKTGPFHITPANIASNCYGLYILVRGSDVRRVKLHNTRHWYWPRSVWRHRSNNDASGQG